MEGIFLWSFNFFTNGHALFPNLSHKLGKSRRRQTKMTEETITSISAKLHPEYDKELSDYIKSVPRRDRSRTYREGLLFYFRHKEKMEGN